MPVVFQKVLSYNKKEQSIRSQIHSTAASGVCQEINPTPERCSDWRDSYVEKGHELIIPKDSVFFLKFRAKDEPDEEDESNYEYEMPEDVKPENSVQESEQVHSNLNNTQSDSDEDSLISE